MEKPIGKSRPLKRLKPGALIPSSDANALIDFYNAFINGKIVNGSANDLFIAKNNIIWQISGNGSNDGEFWPPTNYPATMADVGAYALGQWVYVRSTDEAVTDGVTDPDSGETVYSTPGWYKALRDVPVEVLGMDLFGYHIPLATLPNPDDVGDTTNYWAFFGPALSC